MEGRRGTRRSKRPNEVVKEVANHIRESAIFPETHTNYVSSIQQNLLVRSRTICFME